MWGHPTATRWRLANDFIFPNVGIKQGFACWMRINHLLARFAEAFNVPGFIQLEDAISCTPGRLPILFFSTRHIMSFRSSRTAHQMPCAEGNVCKSTPNTKTGRGKVRPSTATFSPLSGREKCMALATLLPYLGLHAHCSRQSLLNLVAVEPGSTGGGTARMQTLAPVLLFLAKDASFGEATGSQLLSSCGPHLSHFCRAVPSTDGPAALPLVSAAVHREAG